MSKNVFSEDRIAIILGAILLIFSGIVFVWIPYRSTEVQVNILLEELRSEEAKAPFTTVEWHEKYQELEDLKAEPNRVSQVLKQSVMRFQSWEVNPFGAFYSREKESLATAQKMVEGAKEFAIKSSKEAKEREFQNDSLNTVARKKIAAWRSISQDFAKLKGKPVSWTSYLKGYGFLLLILLVVLGTSVVFLGEKLFPFIRGFLVVFGVALLAYLFAAQVTLRSFGLGYALWAIVLGMFISNVYGLPEWLKRGLKHELFIKTGLVLLGAEVLFGKILAIGLPGIFVAWVVTPVVLVTTFWFGQRVLKMTSKTLNITISADMSVCGVSAAIATAAACKAKKEELTTAIGLSMIFTSVMMVVMPAFIKLVNMPEVLGGAWIGGTIDATGAVVAAGAFLGDKALHVAATIKMIQNILIGVIAFGVAVYWSARVDKTPGQRISAGEIWIRFPKFVLGFLGASLLFSALHLMMDDHLARILLEDEMFGYTGKMRGWFFCLAFASIGLSTNFKELKAQFSGGKPLILYVCGQLFNLGLTLLMAWLMFYKVFPEITSTI